jgi:hypothetical protein
VFLAALFSPDETAAALVCRASIVVRPSSCTALFFWDTWAKAWVARKNMISDVTSLLERIKDPSTRIYVGKNAKRLLYQQAVYAVTIRKTNPGPTSNTCRTIENATPEAKYSLC